MQGTWFDPWSKKIPHAEETKPVRHNYWSPHAYSLYSATREATAMRSPHTATKSSPSSPQQEKVHVEQRRPNTAKKKGEGTATEKRGV